MLLDKLIIEINGSPIREIKFKLGLNLILDKSTNVKTESGNSVGKTTTLRVVDYCLGSDGKDIYTDAEFKTVNHDIYDLINNNDVRCILYLYASNSIQIKLERNLSITNQLFYIDNEQIDSLKEYNIILGKLIFNQRSAKPTLRQLIPKFIRSDFHKMSNALNFLHQTTTSATYESIILFLIGFDNHNLLTSKINLLAKKKKFDDKLKSLKSIHSTNALQQVVNIINRDIINKEKELDSYSVSASYKIILADINKIRSDIEKVTNEIYNFELKLDLNKKTYSELASQRYNEDTNLIKSIYLEAKKFIPELQKTFEDAVKFHNGMIERKIRFIEKSIPCTENNINNLKSQLSEYLNKERDLLRLLGKEGALTDLTVIQKKLSELYEAKGRSEQALVTIKDLEEQQNSIVEKINIVNANIAILLKDFDVKLTKFNHYFTLLSNKFYDEEYFLSYELNKGTFKFVINNLTGNVGGGKKKGQVAAFDLAYILYAIKLKSKSPYFVLHDSIEDIHHNQIETLFVEANKMHGQYIVAVLKDKIAFLKNDFIIENTIIELDETNKFFRL